MAAIFEGKEFWSGCVSLIDGKIEEVHTYEEAQRCDFHHSLCPFVVFCIYIHNISITYRIFLLVNWTRIFVLS